MSAPAIAIGHPVSYPPVARSCATSWCGISDSPYAIRNSEFGNPESGIGVQRFLHAMKDSPLTRWVMVR
jgi:hypothetical protein